MKRLKHLKIKNKLIVIILSINLIAQIVGFASIIIYIKKTLEQSYLKDALVTAHVIGNGMVGILNFGDSNEARNEVAQWINDVPDILNTFIFDDKDELFSDFHRSDSVRIEPPPISRAPLKEMKDGYLQLFQPIINKDQRHGTLYLRFSLQSLRSKINNMIFAMVIIIILLTPLSFILATKLQSFISKPILDLGKAAKKVSDAANYSIRVQKISTDEVGILYDSFNDMMEQIQNRDIQRDRVESSLKAAEFFLSSVLDSMPSTLITITQEGHVTQWNTSADRLMGIPAEEAKNKILWELIPDFQKYKNTIKKVLHTKKTIQFYKELIKIKDNSLYLDVTIFPLLETESPRFVIMINNITEIELKEQQLRQSQKMETVGTLAGGLAHDFNNVLGGIIGTISLFKYKVAKKRELKQSEIEKYFTTIEDSANRASDMVQHLLSLTRKQELSFAPTDLNGIIKSTVKICRNTFDKSIEIKASLSREPAMTNVDSTQIEQSVLNLCINASHAMTLMRKEGDKFGGKLNISIEKIKTDKYSFKFKLHPDYRDNEEYWRISVEDTGVGMTEKTMSKIFDPFFTTKGEGKGTGLGLAMVYNIMKQHKGFIDVYSQEGIGTTFHIYLPVYKCDTDLQSIQNKEEIFMGEGLILVVDDEEIMRQTAQSILVECGYRTLQAENGLQAVELFRQHKDEITAVLLDMVMPKMSGKQAYIEISKIKNDIKVLLASGFKQDARVESILELGVNGFIQKPYSLVKLANHLHQIITEDSKDKPESQESL